MNAHLQSILNFIQQDKNLSEEEKNALLRSLKDADKEFEITSFKLDRTEKVKRTTAILLEETIEELEQKRKAVEAQNRELEIEKALEKVRSAALAMKELADMVDVCHIISDQLELLGVKEIRNVQTAIFYVEEGTYCNYEFYRLHDKSLITKVEYINHPMSGAFANQMLKGPDEFFSRSLDRKELEEWYAFQQTTNQFVDTHLAVASSLNYYWCSMGPVALGTSTYEPLDEEEIILFKRFRNVFELAYRRFLDIEQALAQVKEARIETALERVRAVAMAMKKSDDLLSICEVLYKELGSLGFSELRNGLISTFEEGKDYFNDYDYADATGGSITYVPYNSHPIVGAFVKKVRQSPGTFLELVVDESELNGWKEYRKINGQPEDPRLNNCSSLYYYMYSIGISSIGISAFNPLTKDKVAVLERFANVFKLAYQRYNDISLAEAQAKEAQLEASLERMRAVAMSMRKSEELIAVCEAMYKELTMLGFTNIRNAQIAIKQDEKQAYLICEYSDYAVNILQEAAYDSSEIVKELYRELGKSNNALYQKEFSGKEFEEWRTWRKSIKDKIDPRINEADSMCFYLFSMGTGHVGISTFNTITNGQVQILRRFKNVFELSYQRYTDVANAEAQAREAQIELALERVRARTMAMQKSEELAETSFVLFEQFKNLGETSDQVSIGIFNEAENIMQLYSTLYGTQWKEPAKVDLDEPVVMKKIYTAWKEQKKTLVIDISGDELLKYNDYRRALSKLNYKEKRWVIHIAFFSKGMLSFSTPEPHETIQLLERFAGVFDGTYTRFLDLQKAEAQVRESEIQLALERVRARTMAMQKSEELAEVATLLFQQFKNLGLLPDAARVFFNLIDEKSASSEVWTTKEDGILRPGSHRISLNTNKHLKSVFASWKAKKTIYIAELKGKEVIDYFNYLSTVQKLSEDKKLQQLFISPPDKLVFTEAFFKQGTIGIVNTDSLLPESQNTLTRFSIAFEQTYTRFLDLQKAEAQAREAKIEMALEKVRSRTMAMQHSDELPSAANLLFLEVQELGIPSWSCGYNILAHDKKSSTCIMSSEGQIQSAFHLPFTNSGEPSFAEWLRAIETKQSFFVQELSGKAIDDHYNYMNSLPQVGQVLKELEDAGLSLPTYQINHLSFFNGGFLLFITYEQVPHAHDIFKRFTKVFEQTYTRFLDLQKAEAQATEARIEAALERVRSRTMAMHKSNELQEVIETVFDQILKLGILADVANFIIFNQKNKDINCWIASANLKINRSWHMPYKDIFPLNEVFIVKEKGNDSFSTSCSFEQKNAFFNWAFEHSDFKNFPDDRKQFVLESKCWTTSYAWVKHTCIQLSSYSQELFAENENEILKRFARVFEQSYIRFLDLQKAEAQTRQAHIETALERVRARALAMQEPEELKAVAEVLRHEMGLLGVEELETCSIYINDEQAEKAECWYALKDAHSSEQKLVNDHFALDLNDTWVGREMLEFYNTPEEQISIMMQGANRKEWINYCEEKSIPFRGYYGEVIPDRTYHLYKFSHGAIGAAAAGDISTESWGLLKRAAAVFSLAYSRFKDLTQAKTDLIQLKEEKKRAEDALINLQAAQKQLIQSEKMASLGELTAGIAHEIQNPLNFVNNFSEVSKELLDEMNDELEKGNLDDVRDIMKDVIQNLEKINHHGKRADGIVKGMLQHSRSSSGVKEPTDINALADEYLRLTYHGLRAKDKTFNATIKTDFDPSIEKIDVIPQDIGRVVLNLLTNAFYVVNEKKQLNIQGYEPTVSVSTKKTGDKVEITVSDNGNGIPQKILNKIFQPFFSTKPTGQGTGLGLSLSYDIITKGHAGELKVETKEGKGSTFIILLPDNNS